jgi:hypothetical protein
MPCPKPEKSSVFVFVVFAIVLVAATIGLFDMGVQAGTAALQEARETTVISQTEQLSCRR